MPGSQSGGVLPWSTYIDDREYAPDLQWPRSVETYSRMQADAQVKGLLLAATLPIQRFLWEIDPNGAATNVVEHVAADLNLPVRGEEPKPSRLRRRFNHGQHLRHALRALSYGHFYFEEVYDYRSPQDGGDGLLHLAKLGTRPPRTIANIQQNDDGSLRALEQNVWQGALADGRGMWGPPLPADRLVPYIWDSEDDGDWLGRSLLRACFRNWVLKDRELRVDATKHERNSMGVPWFEVDPSVSQRQIDELAVIAQEMRAGERVGGAGPGKLTIKGVEGTLPDTIASVRYQDEQMSKAFLLLFFDLGKTETGSRALGSEFIDWYTEKQGAIGDWYRDTTQLGVVEDIVERNYGPDEQPPRLAYTRLESSELALSDLAQAVQAGLIEVGDELREYIVQRYQLPRSKAAAAPPAEPQPQAPPAGRAQMAEALLEVVRPGMTWPQLARAAGADPKNGTARRTRDELVEAGTLRRHEGGTFSPPSGALKLPEGRELRRQPYEHEVAASIDFATMDQVFMAQRAELIEVVAEAQGDQIAALAAAVEAAGGDAEQLAALSCEPVSTELLLPHLMAAARAGVAAVEGEHQAQLGPGAKARVEAAEVGDEGLLAKVKERARAAALTLAGGLSQAASKRAAALSALAPAAAATAVRDYLSGLSDAALREQLGGATMQAYNTGRREYLRANPPEQIYASELLDENTCGPCTDVDGTEYGSLEEAEGDYPAGGYIDCEGGLRCRGTLVATWTS